jgi:hypothetical protein
MGDPQKLALQVAVEFAERALSLLRSAQTCETEGVDDVSVSKILQVAQDHLLEARRYATEATTLNAAQRTFRFDP